jgi:surface protein
MFYGASAFNQYISTLDTSAVEDMSRMFENATIFNNGEPGIQSISGTAASSNYIDTTRTLSCPNGLFLTELSLNDGIVISTSAGVVYSSQIQPPIVSDVSLVLLTAYGGGNLTAGNITSIQKIPTSVGGNVPLSLWNTGNVQNMKKMFQYALSFNQYIGDWDTQSVTEMSSMFVFASSFNNGQISGLSGASLNAWNTGSVTLMNNMFQNASAFNQPIGDWDTHSVTDMGFIFRNTQFNQPLITNGNKWNTGIVTTMRNMFQYTSDFNQDISSWDTSSVTNMSYMFYKALAFNNGDSGNNGLKPLNNWNTQSVTNMQSMFYSVPTFNQEVTNWDVTNVTTMANMFALATNFNNGDITNIGSKSLSSWDVLNCTSFAGMFNGALSFNQYIGNWNTERVTDMTYMFQNARLFDNGELGTMDISGNPYGNRPNTFYLNSTRLLTSSNSKFLSQLLPSDVLIITYGPIAFPTIVYTSQIQPPIISDVSLVLLTAYGSDISSNQITSIKKQVVGSAPLTWNTSILTPDLQYMFSNATYFNQDVSGITVGNATHMFSTPSSTALRGIFNNGQLAGSNNNSLRNWNTVASGSIGAMFVNSAGFNQNISNWNVSNVGYAGETFKGTQVYNNGQAPGVVSNDSSLNSWNTSSFEDIQVMFSGAIAFNQNISNWDVSRVYTMDGTFSGATLFNNGSLINDGSNNLNNWYAPKSRVFTRMFRSASSFNQAIPILVDSSGIILDAQGDGVDLTQMFQNATKFNQNLNTWNTSKVSNMSSVFSSASVFNNGDASGASTTPLNWITDNVKTMSAMFADARVFNQPIDTSGNYWNTGKVTDMSLMLASSSSLIFNQPIGKWDVSNVTTMFQMLYGAINFNQDISLWKTGSVTTMFQMFRNAQAFNQTINTDASGSWDVSNVTNMNNMFLSATAFNNGSLTNDGLNELTWNAPNCINFTGMFQSATSFNQKVNNLVNTANVIDCSLNGMFQAATIFNNGQLGTMDISGTPFTGAFYTETTRLLTSPNSKFLTQLSPSDVLIITAGTPTTTTIYTSQIQTSPIVSDVSLVLLTAYGSNIVVGTITSIKKQVAGTADLSWNTTNVKNMNSLFLAAYYFNQNINNWSTSNVTNMSSMFAVGSVALRNMFNNGQLAGSSGQPLNWTASNCTIFTSMFAYTSGFNQPMPSIVDTSGVALQTGCTLTSMFQNTTRFNQNISNWNVSRVVNMTNMFNTASAFNNGGALTDTSGNSLTWYVPLCKSFASMFLNAAAFNQPIPFLVDTSGISVGTTVSLASMFQNTSTTVATTFNQNLSSWNVSRVTAMNLMFSRSGAALPFNNGSLINDASNTLTWNAPNCINFSGMFVFSTAFNQPIPFLVDTSGIALPAGCNLTSMFQNAARFNRNLNTWNVSRVTNMTLMFSGTIFNNGDISGNSTQPLTWYAPNCNTFSTMFNAVSAFNQPLPYLVDTSGNTDPSGCSLNAMFQQATRFNQNLNTWNVSRATSISLTFSSASAFNNGRPLGVNDTSLNWYAPMCTTFASMFLTATSFNQEIPNLVDTSNVSLLPAGSTLSSMFQNASRFNQNISAWNVSRVNSMSLMFSGATVFNNSDPSGNNITTLNNWRAPLCTTFATMFGTALAFNQAIPILVDTSGANITACATNSMFAGASIFNQDISLWNVSKANPMNNMFATAIAFNNGAIGNIGGKPLTNWSAPTCITFASMFNGASAFNQEIPILVNTSGLAVATTCTLISMFQSATLFNQNIGAWNVTKVATLTNMFTFAAAFNNGGSTDIQNWSAPACTSFASMFSSTAAFNQPLTNLVNTSSVADCVMDTMFSGAIAFNNGQTGRQDISGNVATSFYTNATAILSFPGAAFNSQLTTNDVLIIATGTIATPIIIYTSKIQRIISDASLVLLTPYGLDISQNVLSIKKQVAGTADLSWNTSNVTTMLSVFSTAYYFNQNISNWNVSRVTAMTSMFAGASTGTALKHTFNNGQLAGSSGQQLNWTASRCGTFTTMFSNNSCFNQPIPTLVDVSGGNLTSMFQNASVFNQNVSTWNTTNVTTLASAFLSATMFNNGQTLPQDISGNPLNASYVTSGSTLTWTDASFLTSDLSINDVLIITTPTLVYSSDISNNITSNTSLVLRKNYGSNISLGSITSIKKQVAGTSDLSWNTQFVTTTANMFQFATYFNQRLPWNMRLNRTVTSMFAGTATFINLFNNGQIITETSQPLYPGGGVNIWDFGGGTITGGTSGAWCTNSRLIIGTGNGVTINPALT